QIRVLCKHPSPVFLFAKNRRRVARTVADIHVSIRFRIAQSRRSLQLSFQRRARLVVCSPRAAKGNRFAFLRAISSWITGIHANFVLNTVIHLVTLAESHMLDPRRVGAASPEVARRCSPLGQNSFESFGSFETFGSFMPVTLCRTNDSRCV